MTDLKKLFEDFGLGLCFEALLQRKAEIHQIEPNEIGSVFHTYYTKKSHINFSFLRDLKGPNQFHFKEFLLPEFFNNTETFVITLHHVPRDYDLILSGMLMSPSARNFLLVLTSDQLHRAWHQKIIELTGKPPYLALTKTSVCQINKQSSLQNKCAEVFDGA
jgi:hypothetical protein